jgi:hypothetical protein
VLETGAARHGVLREDFTVPIVTSLEAQNLAQKIRATNPRDSETIECGLHSGIPPCCVFFFVKVWQYNVDNMVYREGYLRTQNAFLGVRRPEDGPGYVMCPACLLTRNVVQLKK